MDANRYATKKTIAQGMLDVALLTANASQLKYVLQVGEDNHPFYHLMLALIILSIILQVHSNSISRQKSKFTITDQYLYLGCGCDSLSDPKLAP